MRVDLTSSLFFASSQSFNVISSVSVRIKKVVQFIQFNIFGIRPALPLKSWNTEVESHLTDAIERFASGLLKIKTSLDAEVEEQVSVSERLTRLESAADCWGSIEARCLDIDTEERKLAFDFMSRSEKIEALFLSQQERNTYLTSMHSSFMHMHGKVTSQILKEKLEVSPSLQSKPGKHLLREFQNWIFADGNTGVVPHLVFKKGDNIQLASVGVLRSYFNAQKEVKKEEPQPEIKEKSFDIIEKCIKTLIHKQNMEKERIQQLCKKIEESC